MVCIRAAEKSYSSAMISVRIMEVQREPGIISRANLRRDDGSDERSRLLMLSCFVGERNDEKVDIAMRHG